MCGPVVQEDLFSIILRFRKHQIAFTADIAEINRQINLDASQICLQRILWRDSEEQRLNIYELTTATFGTSSSPFLATRVLNQVAADESKNYPLASKVPERYFYVDDILSGADTVENALLLQSELLAMLSSGGFKLHKWSSNRKELLDNILASHRDVTQNHIFDKEVIKTIGLS